MRFFVSEKENKKVAELLDEADMLRRELNESKRHIQKLQAVNDDLKESIELIKKGSPFEQVKNKLETLRLKNLTIEYVEGVQRLPFVRFSGDFYL